MKCAVLALAVLGAKAALATSAIEPATQPQADCKRFEAQQPANLEALKRADPAIDEASLDSVFYSTTRNACMASVFFTKGNVTYSGIFNVSSGRIIWAKSYKGTAFTPVHIVQMDETMDEAARQLEFAPFASASTHSYFLPELIDRTRNTLPAIKNVLMLVR